MLGKRQNYDREDNVRKMYLPELEFLLLNHGYVDQYKNKLKQPIADKMRKMNLFLQSIFIFHLKSGIIFGDTMMR